jgi:hypothetical protein
MQDPRTVVGKVIDSVMGKSHATASDRVADAADAVHVTGGGHTTPEPAAHQEHHDTKVEESSSAAAQSCKPYLRGASLEPGDCSVGS